MPEFTEKEKELKRGSHMSVLMKLFVSEMIEVARLGGVAVLV